MAPIGITPIRTIGVQGSGEIEMLPTRSTCLRISTPQIGLQYKKPPPSLTFGPHPLPVWPIASTSQLVARTVFVSNH